jgi:hypothetical protein
MRNIYLMTYRRNIEQAKGLKTILTTCSENMFNEICANI